MNRTKYHFEETFRKIKASGLPDRFRNKLLCDLEYIAGCGIEELKYIILFGSASRGELKATSDLDLLLITKNQVPRSIKSDIDMRLDEAVDGVGTDIKFYTLAQFTNSDCLFMQEIRKDGKILWKEK